MLQLERLNPEAGRPRSLGELGGLGAEQPVLRFSAQLCSPASRSSPGAAQTPRKLQEAPANVEKLPRWGPPPAFLGE